MLSITVYALALILYPLLSWLVDIYKTGRFAMLVLAQIYIPLNFTHTLLASTLHGPPNPGYNTNTVYPCDDNLVLVLDDL